MTEQDTNDPTFEDVPEAIVQTRKRFSIVWLIPLVAALIGSWLAYKTLSEKGPTVTITFETAEGLEAGKTKIKYKEVEVGQVESISLSGNLSCVVVTANLVKAAEKYLTNTTQFWVVRARVTASEVSGLGTIFSGAYIGIAPGKSGARARSFKGLEKSPIITTDLPGRHFLLRAKSLGSLNIGSPVYFRQIKVGQVVAYELEKEGEVINLRVFVHAPYHKFVTKNTRFWNAGGLDMSVDASGIKVKTESFVTMMIGGVAFDTTDNHEVGVPSEEGETFKLYVNHEKTYEKTYERKIPYLLNFTSSVRGLAIGAPVEFKGIKLGEVTEISLDLDHNDLAFRIPVLIELQPERIKMIGERTMKGKEGMEFLVEKGLRAQLKKGNLLTSRLFVDFDVHPKAPVRKIVYGDSYAELPTIPTPMEEISIAVNKIIDDLYKLPLKQIGKDFQNTMANLSKSTELLQKFVQDLDEEVSPAAIASLKQTHTTLSKIDRLLEADSTMGYEIKHMLGEIADAAQNISVLADYLERHPESLIRGKGERNER